MLSRPSVSSGSCDRSESGIRTNTAVFHLSPVISYGGAGSSTIECGGDGLDLSEPTTIVDFNRDRHVTGLRDTPDMPLGADVWLPNAFRRGRGTTPAGSEDCETILGCGRLYAATGLWLPAGGFDEAGSSAPELARQATPATSLVETACCP